MPVTEDEIGKELLTKAVAFDELQPNVIRRVAQLLNHPLKIINNKSPLTGIIPELKVSLISPIHKNEDETLFSNYRPIAVLPRFFKLFFSKFRGYRIKTKVIAKRSS